MARHRKKPAFRLKARTRRERSSAAEPQERRVGVALRRVMVTPTFAAGLGVVIAATLVYPMSRTVFRYSGPNWGMPPCPASGCVTMRPGAGSPAQANPGRRLKTKPVRSPRQSSSAGSPSLQPVVSYQTINQWNGGFQGLLTLTFPAGRVPTPWGLWFSYPAGKILGLVGGRWHQQRGGHTAVVTSQGYDRAPFSDNAIRINFWASGTAGRPARCSFDRQACHYR